MKMDKEALRLFLHNYPLVQAIEQKRAIDEAKKKLGEAMQTMRDTGVNEFAVTEVQKKHSEYQKVSRAYGRLIEDTWEITWQMESVIGKYTDYSDEDIDRLPAFVGVN